jgi:LPS export ABC transporter protein LptC
MRGPVIILALLAVAVAVIWHFMTATPLTDSTKLAPPAETDYYMRNARLQIMDAEGKPEYRLQAAEILHFPDESMQVNDIQLNYLGGVDSPWQVDAPKGFIPPEQKTVRLSGGVTVLGDVPDGQVVAKMPDLVVDLEREKLHTSSPVSLESPDYRAQAAGMEAGFHSRDLNLLGNGQSEFNVR